MEVLMKLLKGINFLVLITFFVSSVSVTPVHAMTDAADTLKDIYSLKFLDGENGKDANAPILEKITNNPDRALITAAVYGLSLFAAKKLYDLADSYGVFDAAPEQPVRPRARRPVVRNHPVQAPLDEQEDDEYDDADYHVRAPRFIQPQIRVAPEGEPTQKPQRVPNSKPAQNNRKRKDRSSKRDRKPKRNTSRNRHENRPVNPQAPVAPQRQQPAPVIDRANIRIANPMPGQQLHILNDLGNLNGFYHMHSATPYARVPHSCGVQSAYNMGLVQAHVFGRQMNDAAFDNALDDTIASNRVRIAGQPRNQGRVPLRNMIGRRGLSNTEVVGIAREAGLEPVTVLVNAQGGNIQHRAAEFHRAQGPHVVHFLCNVPHHWIAISVVRMADGSQAMYLFDNMNNAARSLPEMRAYVQAIHQRFF